MKGLLRVGIGHFSVERMNAIIKESGESKGSLKLNGKAL
jgi:hypothetical protein